MSEFNKLSELELFAANLQAVLDPRHSGEAPTQLPEFDRTRLGEIVLCPLCLMPFHRDDLDAKILTVEHIVPSAGGGDNLTLTCKDCNNRTGSKLDAQLLKRIKHEADFHCNGGPVRIRLSVGEGQQNAHLYIKQDENGEGFLEVIGLPDQSDPVLQKKLEEALLSSTPSDQELRFDYDLGFVDVLNKTALLRSAYLTMFRFFGYSYILHPTLDAVRRQIWQPTIGKDSATRVTEPHLLAGIWNSKMAAHWGTPQVGWAQTVKEGFIVALFLSARAPSGSLVPMPKTGEADGDFKARLIAPTETSNSRVDIREFIRVPELLVDPVTCHFVRDISANWGQTSKRASDPIQDAQS